MMIGEERLRVACTSIACTLTIIQKQGKSLAETELVQGVVIDKEVLNVRMPRSLDQPKIVLIDLALETSQLSNGAFDISIKPLLDASIRGHTIHDSICDLINFRYITSGPQGITFEREGMGITLDGIAKG